MPTPALAPIDNYKMVLTTKYAEFSGRARRAEYWWFAVVNAALAVASVVIMVVLGAIADPLGIIGVLLYLAVAFGTLIPGLACAVRRLHDTGKSGWFLLVSLIPFVGGIILLVFMFTDGTRETNQYGPSPKY